MDNLVQVSRENASLRQQVTESLRLAILDGQLRPGQKLVERELCGALKISRTLLREALQQLQAEGLIATVLHKGPFVALIGADEAGEIYEVRRVLEGLVGRGFAQNATDAEVAELRAQLEAIRPSVADGSPRDLLIAKGGFYAVLYEGCRNRVATQILTQLNNRMMLYKRLSLSAPGRPAEMLKELDAIVAAIETRDPDLTAGLCAIHVANARRTVMRQLSLEQDKQLEPGNDDGQGSLRKRA
jgi:DNA-binding GntR family transcriptional regulator